jgi:hypothetical protein
MKNLTVAEAATISTEIHFCSNLDEMLEKDTLLSIIEKRFDDKKDEFVAFLKEHTETTYEVPVEKIISVTVVATSDEEAADIVSTKAQNFEYDDEFSYTSCEDVYDFHVSSPHYRFKSEEVREAISAYNHAVYDLKNQQNSPLFFNVENSNDNEPELSVVA